MTIVGLYLHGVWVAFVFGLAYRSINLARSRDMAMREPWKLETAELDALRMVEKSRWATSSFVDWLTFKAIVAIAMTIYSVSWPLFWPLEFVMRFQVERNRETDPERGYARLQAWIEERGGS